MTTPEKIQESLQRTRLLDRMLTLGRLERQAKLNERLVRRTQDGTLGKAGGLESEESMATILVGGDLHISGETQKTAGMSRGMMAAALVALGLTTGGIGALIPLLLGSSQEPSAPVVKDTDTDTDTQYRLEFAD